MKIFFPDCVTIVRKKGDEFFHEAINTCPVLSGTAATPGKLRDNVIRRLRKDPSVILVLEDKDGVCSEESVPYEGFIFKVDIKEDGAPYGVLDVLYDGNTAFHAEYGLPDDVDDDLEDGWALKRIVRDITDILTSIDMEDFSFVDNDCPGFAPADCEDEEFDIHDAERILKEEGFEVERVYTVGYLSNPLLMVHENEVVLLGSRHFDGESLFVEMKRIFFGVAEDDISRALDIVRSDYHDIDAKRLADGSWSFRTCMEVDTCKNNFIANLLKDIDRISELIGRVEDSQGVGPEPWSIMGDQKQLFIHEVIEASLLMSKLPM